ncbi:tRNA pseudouridine(38-40) synthase TruA [Porticoccus sp.]|uniref:tRNA pseudouridine(38-40) synthase TruA n=1 Tax=Porticoccus sp. TaxID=2024853 RepID=UPI003F69D6CE
MIPGPTRETRSLKHPVEDFVLPAGVKRIAAAVEYCGSAFSGWQRQSHSPSVQASVEAALSKVANEGISVICAGRTDTGVHATNQIIHFDTAAKRKDSNWLLGANANLPFGIRLHWVSEQTADFHARFSATARTYRYLIVNQPQRSALFYHGLSWEKRSLETPGMHRAIQLLIGEHDFSSFRASGCQSNSPNRNVHRARVWRQANLVIIEITANAFLHHMVRNIVGALVCIGRGDRSIEWLRELLLLRDRTKAPPTAPPNGLYLVKVNYPDGFRVPQMVPGPQFIAEV